MSNNKLMISTRLYFMYKKRPCIKCIYCVKYEDNYLEYRQKENDFIKKFSYPKCMLFSNRYKYKIEYMKSYDCRIDNNKCSIFGLYYKEYDKLKKKII